MTPLTRRTFLASAAAVGLSGAVPIASAKPKSDAGTTVRLKVNDAVANAATCYLPRDVASALAVGDGQQVRLLYEGDPVVFTAVVHDDKFGAVSTGGRNRFGVDKNSLRVDTDARVVHPTMDRETAADTGEFIERHIAGSTSAIAVAPHGGYIEYGTDHQARRFADRLGASAWYCSGWWPGGGAYRRWHITSTYIDPRSFPALGEIRNTGYDTAVSFHGWSESFIAIGGTAPVALREEIQDSIRGVVDGEFDVRLATDPARNGTDPENLVNWLTTSGQDGIQLEQPRTARQQYGSIIADAVAEVIGQ